MRPVEKPAIGTQISYKNTSDDVRKALIGGFEGTCAVCFDASDHYEPIPRNLGMTDSV